MNQLQALFYELLYKIVSYLPTLVQGAKKCLVMRTLIVKYQTEMLCMWDFLSKHTSSGAYYTNYFLNFKALANAANLGWHILFKNHSFQKRHTYLFFCHQTEEQGFMCMAARDGVAISYNKQQ